MLKTPLSIAGLHLLVRQPEGSAGLCLPESFDEYRDDRALVAPDVEVAWNEASALPVLPELELLCAVGSSFRIFRDPCSGGYIAESYLENGYRLWSRMTVSADWTRAELCDEVLDGPSADGGAFDMGELLVRTRLPFHDGIVFHASGIDDNGKGILFVAHSGVGKSTQALIWAKEPGVILINHDRMAVRCEGGNATAYGLPWGGTQGVTLNHSVPLNAIVLLEQAAENALTLLRPIEALPYLLSCTFMPFWSAEELDRVVGVQERIAARVPVFRLKCRPEPSVVQLVRSVLT